MNKERRKQIEKLAEEIRQLFDLEKIDELFDGARSLGEEEREYYDNMPESLQGGEKGEQADAAATALEESAEALEELRGSVEEILAKLEEAAQ
jgi:DNA repair ATPase RecN